MALRSHCAAVTMDQHSGQWLQSPSGSRAEALWPDEQPYNTATYQTGNLQSQQSANDAHPWSGVVVASYEDEDDDEYTAMSTSHALASGELRPGELMNNKIPPAWNGGGSWFAYEELVYDWEDSCILDKDKRGPALKNRLCDEAAVYKPMLDREKLKSENNGADYFLNTMRPHFVKGVQNVFLYRLFQFMQLRRGRLEINRWIAKYALMRKRLRDSWMDLYKPTTRDSTDIAFQIASLRNYCQANEKAFPTDDIEQLRLINELNTVKHEEKFPFSDNLFTLIFMVSSQLQESQRTLLTSHLTMRGLTMENYQWEIASTLYMKLLCVHQSSLEDPSLRNRTDFRGARTFYVLSDLGECEGSSGYWVQEDSTGFEGFLEEHADVFWVLDDNNAWVVRRFNGRSFTSAPLKGKGKGKGKRGRSRFRSYKGRSKGKSKGRPYVAEEEEYRSNETWGQSWQEETGAADAAKGKSKGKKGKGKGKAYKGKGK